MKNLKKKVKTKYWAVLSLLAMNFYGNPSSKLKIVGVTGTNGKTTTATLLYRIVKGLGYKVGLISTVENLIDGEKRASTHTTPDSISLSKLLAEMVDKGCEYAFMEVSSHAMDQNRVAGINFAGGIFTNLTHDHLDYHKSFENYFNAKKKFFKMLPHSSFALANVDDEHGVDMLEGIKARPYSYGFGMKAKDYRGEIKKLDFSGLGLDFNGQHINSKLLGKFNAYNLLAVWSASELLGFDMEKVKKVLEEIKPPRGRFDHFMSPSGVLVVVDYAHTPDALEKIFGAVKEVKPSEGKIISVFGCGGDRDPLKRRIMGKIGATLSDIAIFTSDNPRSEDPSKIIAEMKTDLTPAMARKVTAMPLRREAILHSVKIAQKGDIILCAGKGHEDYQEIKGVKYHFDDIEEYKKAYSQK
ncbi:MAG: UDP-N-acetylmuramoyl-L-alanyl-D-glutamate--2,6-diaminopimelate ligase [Candidatus Paceibacterota bacterium]|jgi:UDP-N-acetylmuramoyl-L-alanyl-D-glutamate--2,6-diaminopimelate ligase